MKNQLNLRHVKQFSALTLALSLVLPLTAPSAYAAPKGKVAEDACDVSLRKPPTVPELLANFKANARKDSPVISAEKLRFLDTEGKDVYNISAEFNTTINGKPVRALMGRVEKRGAEGESQVWFFTEVSRGVFAPIPGAQKYDMQDPFFSFIGGELVMGGVQTYEIPGQHNLGYRTVFYRDGGKGIENLKEFTHGPAKMKDIRLYQLPDGRIFVVTRPQNEDPKLGGPGKNAFLIINKLDDLNPQSIMRAKINSDQVPDKQWIGTNEIHMFNGKLVFLSHVAYYKHKEINDDRGYYVALYSLEDMEEMKALEPKIILARELLPNGLFGESMRSDLIDILFAGGAIFNNDGTITLYVGAGDAEAYRVTIKNPLIKQD